MLKIQQHVVYRFKDFPKLLDSEYLKSEYLNKRLRNRDYVLIPKLLFMYLSFICQH